LKKNVAPNIHIEQAFSLQFTLREHLICPHLDSKRACVCLNVWESCLYCNLLAGGEINRESVNLFNDFSLKQVRG